MAPIPASSPSRGIRQKKGQHLSPRSYPPPSPATETAGCQKTLCRVTHGIRTALNRVTAEYLDDLLSYLTHSPKYVTLAGGIADLLFSSWRDIGVYDADFGRGLDKIVHMRRFDIGVAKPPSRLQITLEEKTLARLTMDPL